ncbi:MAG: phosphotransferase, partial [Gemmatales bacterium]|nr:phosphotransferase [Gemmatales bacterium]MDW8388256.1 phosphotransferase [Gemmatales bacterium]
VPQMVGALHYALGDAMPMTLAQVQGWVANEGDAWQRTVTHFASMLRGGHGNAETATDFTLLGRRTGELHLALASATDDPAFAPEEMTKADLVSLVQQMHDRLDKSLQVLRNQLPNLNETDRDLSRKLLSNSNLLRKRIQVPELSATVPKIRVHGDYHLGQVLCTPDGDFVIVDFEGEPARPLAERRAKHCPLKDVAGMLRSFDYAAQAALRGLAASVFEASAISTAERLANQASRQYLNGYYAALDSATVLPRDVNLRNQLLNLFVLDKALYELLYEANNRPDWIAIPLTGLIRYASGLQV